MSQQNIEKTYNYKKNQQKAESKFHYYNLAFDEKIAALRISQNICATKYSYFDTSLLHTNLHQKMEKHSWTHLIVMIA